MTLENNIIFILLFLTLSFVSSVLWYTAYILNKNRKIVQKETVGQVTFQHIEAGATFNGIFALIILFGLIGQSLHLDLDLRSPIAAILVFALVVSFLWMVIALARHAWLWAGRLR